MRRRLIDRDDTSYGIGLGPLTTLGKALALWARNLLPLTGFALVPALGTLAFEWLALAGMTDSGMTPVEAQQTAASVSGLMTFPLAFGATAATFLLLDARIRGAAAQPPSANFYGRGLKLFGRLFGVYFLMGLVVLAPLVPAGVMWKLDLIAVAIPLGAIAIGFDVWLLVRWSMAAPIAVLEDQTFSVAFARSKELVKGAWWRTFATLLLIGLATAALTWGIWEAGGAIGDVAETDGITAQALPNFAISVITTPPLDCVLFALYAALHDRQRSNREPNDS
ncbi:MAG: hypothetical protein JRF63_05195 [Deltaproteobacteria bacterium]|nr:hypothetical protein [Deltaproteobacteria bacterium]